MAQTNFVAWRYTDKQGSTFVRRADSRMTAQQGDNAPLGAIGGSSAAGLSPYTEMPRNLRPRYARVKEAGQAFTARVVIYTKAALDALVPGTTTFKVYDGGGGEHVCTVLDTVDEGPTGAIGA